MTFGLPSELAALAVALEDPSRSTMGGTTRTNPELLPTRADVLACQFSSWYPVFSNLPPNNPLKRKNVTIKSIVLDLPDAFREYMVADGVRLPEGAHVSSGLMDGDENADEWSSDDDSSADERQHQHQQQQQQQSLTDDETPETPNFQFPKLNQQIEAAIAELGGAVVPKLNWSCPKDAVWMNSGTLQCRTAGDVYLLTKTSDFCSYDVHHALRDVVELQDSSEEDCVGNDRSSALPSRPPLQLALRKWCQLYPSQEFRCFVRNNKLVAACQRQSSQHYPHLVRDADRYQALLVAFYEAVLLQQRDCTPGNYVFDVYVDKKDRVWLVDLNVWGSRTDALLFAWSELLEMEEMELRVVETERQVQVDPLSSYKAPIDVIHVAGEAKEFEKFMKLCQPPSVLDAEEVERQQREMERLNSID